MYFFGVDNTIFHSSGLAIDLEIVYHVTRRNGFILT